MKPKASLRLTDDVLRQFQGDTKRYRHSLNRQVLYTPGVQYLAEKGEAYWLLDTIASFLFPDRLHLLGKQDPRILEMQFWSLTVVGELGLLTARADQDGKILVLEQYPFTDFPLDSVEIWAAKSGKQWTLYLPSEH